LSEEEREKENGERERKKEQTCAKPQSFTVSLKLTKSTYGNYFSRRSLTISETKIKAPMLAHTYTQWPYDH
jgi:hypothetical protein